MTVPYDGPPTIYKNIAIVGATVGETSRSDGRAIPARSTSAPARNFGISIRYRSQERPDMRPG